MRLLYINKCLNYYGDNVPLDELGLLKNRPLFVYLNQLLRVVFHRHCYHVQLQTIL